MKSKIKYLCLIIGLLINIGVSFAELNHKTAYVKIVVDKEVYSNADVQLDVSVHSYYHINVPEFYDEREKVQVHDPIIEMEFKIDKDISVLAVKVYADHSLQFSLEETTYLIEKGDSLVFHIGNLIRLSGKGNEKNIIRSSISRQDKRGYTSWFTYYINQNRMDKYFSLQNDYYDAVRLSKLNYLNKLQKKYGISEEIYAYIKEEAIYETEIRRLNSLYGSIRPGSLYRKEILPYAEAEFKNIKEKGKLNTAGSSYKYVQYLMELINAGIAIPQYAKDLSLFGLSVDFKEWYEKIGKISPKSARDQALTFLFSRFQTGSVNADLVIDDVINLVSDPKMKIYLENIKEKRYSKNPIYPFELIDENGKLYTPESFKGKKVVFDFWFYGCRGCIVLHKYMVQFEKELNDPDVLFVSVNVSKTHERWIKGLETGQYTSKEGLNLRLIDSEQKMLSYYEYFSFPQLLVMDEQGRVLAYNMPKPITDKNKEQFKEILYN